MKPQSPQRSRSRSRKKKAAPFNEAWLSGKMLNPRLDVVFKMLFTRNKPCLIDLLSAVLGRSVADVDVLSPEIQRETVIDKGAILNLRVRLNISKRPMTEAIQLTSTA